MSVIHNFTGEPIQARLLNGSIADFPPEESPVKVVSKKPLRNVLVLDDVKTKDGNYAEIIITGNTVSLQGDGGFPPLEPDVYYIVTNDMVQSLRKMGRRASDLLIAEQTGQGYYVLNSANTTTQFSDDDDTQQVCFQTWQNHRGVKPQETRVSER